MKRVKLIGLTGQTGSGKSTVAGYFEQSGFAVINADALVKRVYEKGGSCLAAVSANFGEDILNPSPPPSSAAATAPQPVCPRTRMNRQPRCSAAYSTLPSFLRAE